LVLSACDPEIPAPPSPDPVPATPMQTIEFRLSGAYIELHNLLKVTGVVPSGGAGKALVAAGRVRVDGAVELRKTCKIRPGQVASVGDVRIAVARDVPGDPPLAPQAP
jgi:ribosome-associated protein